VLRDASAALIGADPADPAEALARARLPSGARAARAALDAALHDLAARRRGVSVATLVAARLGTPPRPELEVNALLASEAPEATAREARVAVRQGFRTLKLKLAGSDLARGLDRVAAVRGAVGGGVRVRVDANASLDAERAVAAARELARLEVEFLEQPVPAAALDALAWLRARRLLPIAADESAATPGSARRVVAARAADLVVVKPSVLGGIECALDVALLADRAGLGVVVTSALDGAIGLAAARELAAALPVPLPACGLATGALLADDLAHAPAPRAGRIEAGACPGLGVAPEPDALERLRTGADVVIPP
jgi:L-alanine-DL-glutamate epimerase-like enolase superfamily enzyme